MLRPPPRWVFRVPPDRYAPGAPGPPPGGMGCYVTMGRENKTSRLLGAWAAGVGQGVSFSFAEHLQPVRHHVLWGQIWTAETVVPAARARGDHVWQLDNGWVHPACGGSAGHYRVTLDGPAPRFIPGAPLERVARLGVTLAPWRREGRHVLVALPGPSFGRAWGLDMPAWVEGAPGGLSLLERVQAATDRPVVVRRKDSTTPLAEDLDGAWAVVTHSSNVAVDAVLAGVPVVCEPSSPTAPLGNLGLGHLERPHLAERAPWLASLLRQQWTLEEMRSGEAWQALRALSELAAAPRAVYNSPEYFGPGPVAPSPPRPS